MTSASDPLRVYQRFEGLAVVLRTTGEIDMSTAPLLADELTQAITAATAPAPVVADLSDVTFLSSAGLAVLLDAREKCTRAGCPLRLVATGRPVLRSLEVAGLLELLDVYPTVTDAVTP
ncbi:STAS domain-containing protein [Actinocrispum wychmicini]|uniref:Anti-sigma factor antagonist n=1 Tax=Actinocrispum wychmicini TaxID=1213861 RepID=A0A4R2JHL1_9PSEU|nr:STAS domain-containing protein [Actinocrispum wychmicini]TCO53605.1 anti-anti-sigma factor [Actinocrispum wychmicini]